MTSYTRTMRNLSIKILALAVILIVICILMRFRNGNTISAFISNPGFPESSGWQDVPDDLIIEMENENVVRVEKVRIRENYIEIFLRAVGEGSTSVNFRKNGNEGRGSSFFFKTDRWLTIVCNHTYFTGLEVIIPACGIFLLGVAGMFILTFFRLKGPELYSYTSIFMMGLTILFGAGGAGIMIASVRYLLDPYYNGIPVMLDSIWAIPNNCMLYMTVPMGIFAAAMIISNIELLRHERFRLSNILGILIAVLMIGGEILPFLLAKRSFSGTSADYKLRLLIDNVYIMIYVYFECMLAGSVICGLRAAKHRVSFDRDYIIILGCRFRKDGTLTPLLKGRCDRAIKFREDQLKETGKEAVLIPSGGQGADESMPESHAMAKYLVGAGVPEDQIICEDKSTNTYQNMLFSKKIIEEKTPAARTAFATTHYHIFRSGVWASLAGLRAEGIGSSTKWWFWPNAFMRECIGLFANRVKEEILLLVCVVLINAGLVYLIAF